MKNLIILLLLFPISEMMAQGQQEVEMIQSFLGAEKREIVKEFVNPPDDKEAAFWKLYDEYESIRRGLGQERVKLLTDYKNSYATMTDSKMNDLIKKSISLGDQQEKLILKYYKRIQKNVNAVTAGQFYQFEYFVLSKIRAEIFGSIPVINKSVDD